MKSKLRARAINSRVIYANLEGARALGARPYQEVADSDVRLLWGELMSSLSCSAWPSELGVPAAQSLPKRLRKAAKKLGSAIERAAQGIAADEPRIVGFSSSFQQNVASIILARHLRRLCPSSTIVIGGANMDAPMGAAFHERFATEFDHVFSGEADASFPDFCEDALGPRRIAYPQVIKSLPAPAEVFAGIPDFEDYFLQGGAEIQAELVGERILPFEVSRGCWWGQKHHCTFCGLNANGMQHRAKPGAVIEVELDEIVRRHSPKLLFATDNIMPVETVRSGLPLHLAAGTDFRFFFETKSNLSTTDLDRLVQVGIWEIQPGIESFSTAVLKLLRKGNSGPEHVCLLREAASRQIHVTWNLLVDVPGDQESDYNETLELVPALAHLQPPTGCAPIRIDRYSPYFATPDAFEISNVRPIAPFTALFGGGKPADDMCYFFEADYPSASRRSPRLAAALEAAIATWRQAWAEPSRRRSLVGLRNRTNEYLIIAQTGGAPPEVTAVPKSHEAVLFKTRRPQRAALLSSEETEVLSFYVSRDIVAMFEDQYIFLPTEPWRGAELRGECGDLLAAAEANV
ncbi:RiPP maturation radical SAM C-methyltransferase [Mesorhizobium sp. M0859]